MENYLDIDLLPRLEASLIWPDYKAIDSRCFELIIKTLCTLYTIGKSFLFVILSDPTKCLLGTKGNSIWLYGENYTFNAVIFRFSQSKDFFLQNINSSFIKSLVIDQLILKFNNFKNIRPVYNEFVIKKINFCVN